MKQRFSRSVFLSLIVLLCGVMTANGLESWARSFGSHARIRLPRYLTGFSMVEADRTDALEIARTQALDDLIRKVRVSIRSEIVTRERDDGRRANASYSSVTRSSSELQVAEPAFLIDEDETRIYALAYVEVSTLARSYADSTEQALKRLRRANEQAADDLADGRIEDAEEALRLANTNRDNAETAFGVLESLRRLSAIADREFSADIRTYESELEREYQTVRELENEIERFTPERYENLVEHLARQLSASEYRIVGQRPLRYENADFSSEFGSRLVSAVSDELRQRSSYSAGAAEAVLEGGYWIDGEEIELSLRVRDSQSGEVLRSERAVVPVSAAGDLEIQPADLDSALANEKLLIGEATVEGGISVDVWTNKGRDQDVLVFEQGEELQFYFRVNQPAFLRLTYELASGDLVMLEPQFYIGVDRVNRVVELPYRFVVVPPFGVERLIVTASSEPPPAADTHIRIIDGQQYEVFGSAEGVVGRTRGLARVDDRDEDQAGGEGGRVGEASLTITTVREAEE